MKRVILGILTALLISGTAFAGWNVLENKQKSPSTNTQQPDQTAPKPSEDTYLVIKEWGVRFKVPANVGNVSYKESDARKMGRADIFTISMNSLDFSSDSTCAHGDHEVFGLSRRETVVGKSIPPKFKTIGGHDYYLTGCESTGLSEDTISKVDSLDKSIRDTLEVTN